MPGGEKYSVEERAQSAGNAKMPGQFDWDVTTAVCARESRALPPPALETPEHPVALPGTSVVIRRFNRDTARLAMLVVGVEVLAVLVGQFVSRHQSSVVARLRLSSQIKQKRKGTKNEKDRYLRIFAWK